MVFIIHKSYGSFVEPIFIKNNRIIEKMMNNEFMRYEIWIIGRQYFSAIVGVSFEWENQRKAHVWMDSIEPQLLSSSELQTW